MVPPAGDGRAGGPDPERMTFPDDRETLGQAVGRLQKEPRQD